MATLELAFDEEGPAQNYHPVSESG